MKQVPKKFALCVDNRDYKVDLILGKVYPITPDPRAEKDDFIRIFDESGEDYLYHKSHFVFVDFPTPVRKVILGVMRPPAKSLESNRRRVKVISKRQHSPRASRS